MFETSHHRPAAAPVCRRDLRLVAAERRHVPAITAIYRAHVAHGFATAEDAVPDEHLMAGRLAAVRAAGLPALVALDEGDMVLGFAWAKPWRERAGYRLTVEDSIYVASVARRLGVGGRLLERLIEACAELGCRRMIAVVGDARNRASIALHEAAGFEQAGYFPGANTRSLAPGVVEEMDTVMLQRSLAAPSLIGHA